VGRVSILLVVSLGALIVALPVVAVEPETEENAAAASAGGASVFLKGVDLNVPAQEGFRGWPPPEFRNRVYPLPWSRYVFQQAKLFGRPLLFVLGVPSSRPVQRFYTETIQDPRVQEAINEGFVLVVVNADRHPDIKERYQTGTWPSIALLMPDGNPMVSQANPQGKSLPITAGFLDAEGMLFLLEQGRLYFDKWRNFLEGVGQHWARSEDSAEGEPGKIDAESSDRVARWLLGNEDRTNGGFGSGARFVVPGLVEYAAIRGARGAPALGKPTRRALDKLLDSALYDGEHGGVHRIASTAEFAGIQYEKPLATNVRLLRELCWALREEESPLHRSALEGTTRFLTTVLARPDGGFNNAQMADPKSKDGGGYWQAPAGEAVRPPPVDRLVLSGPNALAAASLLRVAALTGDENLEVGARKTLNLVLERAYTRGRGVDHVIEANPDPRRYLTTQAEAAFGFADAYEATGDRRYLDAAKDIVDFSWANLRSGEEAALRDHLAERDEPGILGNPRRPVEDNVLLARVMLRLGLQGLGSEYTDRAKAILGRYAGNLAAYQVHGAAAALGIEEAIRPPMMIRIDGGVEDPAARPLRRAALRGGAAWTVIVTGDPRTSPPSATIEFRGTTRSAATPGELLEAVRQLTSAGRAEKGK
jgi:hypothetical protein